MLRLLFIADKCGYAQSDFLSFRTHSTGIWTTVAPGDQPIDFASATASATASIPATEFGSIQIIS